MNYIMSLLKTCFCFFALLCAVQSMGQQAYNFSYSEQQPSGTAVQLSHPSFFDLTLSPNGERMLYIEFVNGHEQLFLSSAHFAHSSQITFDDADHEDPAWSPDGKHIAFVKISDSSEVIYMMDTLGRNIQRLSPEGMKTIHASWSPDSKLVLFCTDDDLAPPKKNSSDIYSINISTGDLKKIISGGTNTFPVLSPDGKKLAFRKMIGEKNSEIFIADADGSNQQNISNHPAFDGWPCWSPDGNWIAFASNRNSNYQETARNTYQIFVMDKDGNHVSLIANTTGRATAPKWSPDGRYIYMTNCVQVGSGFDCNLYMVNVSKNITGS